MALTQVEAKPEETTETVTTGKSKSKVQKTGNLILDIASEVESLSKTKALNEAERLAETIDIDYFRLGGILKLINDNSWFEGAVSFAAFVKEHYNFKHRKAMYLISIYDNLVTKQIPWEKVSHLGWTKLKVLAPKLTLDNVDEWATKAEKLSVTELEAALSAGEGDGEAGGTVKTSDEFVKIAFKLKQDQADIVQTALAKAKGELKTEFDTVALENICSGYVGGTSAVAKAVSLEEIVQAIGMQPALQQISDLFPEFDISVGPAKTAEQLAAEAAEAAEFAAWKAAKK